MCEYIVRRESSPISDEEWAECGESCNAIDNCTTESFNCDSCIRNGDCLEQGIDGRPRWEEENC